MRVDLINLKLEVGLGLRSRIIRFLRVASQTLMLILRLNI